MSEQQYAVEMHDWNVLHLTMLAERASLWNAIKIVSNQIAVTDPQGDYTFGPNEDANPTYFVYARNHLGTLTFEYRIVPIP